MRQSTWEVARKMLGLTKKQATFGNIIQFGLHWFSRKLGKEVYVRECTEDRIFWLAHGKRNNWGAICGYVRDRNDDSRKKQMAAMIAACLRAARAGDPQSAWESAWPDGLQFFTYHDKFRQGEQL